jgi:hypothetical protein
MMSYFDEITGDTVGGHCCPAGTRLLDLILTHRKPRVFGKK